ncbi:MAG: Cro/Cl family transcriptional regulator [Glaciihabitans sp.]|nr:Cro/Cl family transcriptional regulator [Glaciihabitans sp.]
MHMQPEGTSRVLAHVGANVHRFRLAANLSQVALADRAGISRRTIIKLESGEANISLTGLDHLADALGVTFVDLVAAPAAAHADISELAWKGQPGSSAVLLASVPAAKNAQLWAWVLEPGDRYDAEPDPEGWSELLMVSEGTIRVEQERGDIVLAAGDHLTFGTAQQYSYVNDGTRIAHFVRVVVS